MTSKPKILVARAIFPDDLAKLQDRYEVLSNQADEVFTPDEHYSSSDYNSIKDTVQSKYY